MFNAFLVGWLGLLHCYSMCGGIVGALSMNLAPHIRAHQVRIIIFTFFYNLGRITSYTMAGYISGLSGKIFTTMLYPIPTGQTLRVITGFLITAIGAYVAGWLPKLAHIERIGNPLWQYLWPLAKNLIPVKTWLQAWLFGLIWGFLPCGLVYSMLILAAFSDSPAQGALHMLAFGIGTLPGLWFGGLITGWLAHLFGKPKLQFIAGTLLIISGLITVWSNIIFHP